MAVKPISLPKLKIYDRQFPSTMQEDSPIQSADGNDGSSGTRSSSCSDNKTPNRLKKWKRIDREKKKGEKEEEVDSGKPFVFKTKSWSIKPGAKKEVGRKIKLPQRDFSGYQYVLKDPDLRGVVPRYRKFQAGEGELWSTTEYRELLAAYETGGAIKNEVEKVLDASVPAALRRDGEQSQEPEMEKASDHLTEVSTKAKCAPVHLQKMQSDQCNTITATEAASRTMRQGQVTTGFMKLLISGAILLCLTGMTLTIALLGIVMFSFLVIISSPIWVPIATILLISMIGFLWVCGLGAALIFGLPWMYKYLRGTHPLGSDWVDDARNLMMGNAGQMRDYAREYLRSKVKDVDPGA